MRRAFVLGQFCDAAKVVIILYKDLAKFGHKQDMKVLYRKTF
jgi:hypothetical protein